MAGTLGVYTFLMALLRLCIPLKFALMAGTSMVVRLTDVPMSVLVNLSHMQRAWPTFWGGDTAPGPALVVTWGNNHEAQLRCERPVASMAACFEEATSTELPDVDRDAVAQKR